MLYEEFRAANILVVQDNDVDILIIKMVLETFNKQIRLHHVTKFCLFLFLMQFVSGKGTYLGQ